MNAIVCAKCGSNDLVERGGEYICKHCGTRFAKQQSGAQRPINVNFVYNNNESSTRANSYEAELLDKEIRICEVYNRLKAQADKKTGLFDKLFEAFLWFYIPYVVMTLVGNLFGVSDDSFMRMVIFKGIAIVLAILSLFNSCADAAKLAKEKAANAPELERVIRLYNQITLIPEEYRHQDELLRKFYDEYGARTQKVLLDRMVEANRKTTIIKNYY